MFSHGSTHNKNAPSNLKRGIEFPKNSQRRRGSDSFHKKAVIGKNGGLFKNGRGITFFHIN